MNFLLEEIINKIIEDLYYRFENKIESIYGIGSFFDSEQLKLINDIDIIILLSDIYYAPISNWKNYRFEKKIIEHNNEKYTVSYLYGDLKHYLHPTLFQIISFANWEWAIRNLKYNSSLLYGKDIRDQLPTPMYNLVQIFKRSMYYLEPNSEKKIELCKQYNNYVSEEMRFSKSIFKFGFFLIASICPDENIFDKQAIYNKLKYLTEIYKVKKEFLSYYEQALRFRNGIPFTNFSQLRKNFILFAINEGMNQLEISWNDTEEKKGMKTILMEGLDNKKFLTILLYYENFFPLMN